jgi:integrase
VCLPDGYIQLTKGAAREGLQKEIATQTGQNLGDKIMKDGSVTFGWFVPNRYYPLRDWRPETEKVKKIQIERDLVEKFDSVSLEGFEQFTLQKHLKHLATFLSSEDRVKHARSYMKSIFAEAVEQDFLLKDPTRGIKIPRNLREKDKTTLTWHQLRAVRAGVATRGRMLLTLEMTDALRPSELFALRWRSFDGSRLTITETVYRGKIRPFGKTEKSLGDVLLPKGMVDDLWLWKQECSDSSPDAFIFPNTEGGFMDTGNYRNRILNPLAEKLGLPKLNFQVLRRTMATLAQRKGSVKDIQAHLRHSKADTTANEYMQELPESVGRMVESMYEELTHSQAAASADLLPNATNDDGSPTANCLKNMAGTTGLEQATSTVSKRLSAVTYYTLTALTASL